MNWFDEFIQDNQPVGGGGGGDVAPPSESAITPTPDTQPGSGGAFSSVYQVAKDTPIVRDVVDVSSAIAYVSITVKFSDRQHTESVYQGKPSVDGVNGFVIPYRAFSSVSGSGAAGVGHTFSMRRDDGWPGQSSAVTGVTIRVKAVDAAGNVLS